MARAGPHWVRLLPVLRPGRRANAWDPAQWSSGQNDCRGQPPVSPSSHGSISLSSLKLRHTTRCPSRFIISHEGAFWQKSDLQAVSDVFPGTRLMWVRILDLGGSARRPGRAPWRGVGQGGIGHDTYVARRDLAEGPRRCGIRTDLWKFRLKGPGGLAKSSHLAGFFRVFGLQFLATCF